jgi:hypothetical protein
LDGRVGCRASAAAAWTCRWGTGGPKRRPLAPAPGDDEANLGAGRVAAFRFEAGALISRFPNPHGAPRSANEMNTNDDDADLERVEFDFSPAS